MSATGNIQVHAYTSKAQLPLKDVAITVTDPQGKTIAYRTTDRSGLIEPIPISVPDLSAGTSPNTGIVPFGRINIYANLADYEQIDAEDVQIFPDTVTYQKLEMIPLSELPGKWNQAEIFKTPAQNL